MTTPKEKRRRIVPVACRTVRGEPDGIHLAVEEWMPRCEEWMTGPALCGRSAEQGALADDTPLTCTTGEGSCKSYRDSYQRILDGRPTAEQELIAKLHNEVAALTTALEPLNTARLNQPLLRSCLYPGCISEFDLNATRCGRVPERASWSSKGWVQVPCLSGYMCPQHAGVVTAHGTPGPHLPRWAHGTHRAPSVLRCPCGWDSPPARWRGFAIEAWKDHVLTVASEGAR